MRSLAPTVTFGKEPVYKIDKDMNFERYDSQAEMAKATGMNSSSIGACLAGKTKMVDGCTILYANDVEKVTKGEEVVLDTKKMIELAREKMFPKAIYVIDSDYNCVMCENKDELAKLLGQKTVSISDVYHGEPAVLKGKVIVKASSIETVKEDGSVSIDKKKVKNLVDVNLFRKAIYAFDEDGNWERFPSSSELAKQYGCSRNAVYRVLTGKTSTLRGKYIASATDVESVGRNGKLSFDKIRAMYYIRNLNFVQFKIDENGNYVKCTPREILESNLCFYGKI